MMGIREVENSDFLKTVGELMRMSFFIPSYQRGYRWGIEQVEDLLNDIDNFVPQKIKGTGEDLLNDIDNFVPQKTQDTDTWYCLQPIVVQECNEDTRRTHSLPDKTYEVIDGQQRLTTFRLIIHYSNEMWRGKQQDDECVIKYETRPKIGKFLDDLSVSQKDNDDNVDYFHISQAYKAIHNWAEKRRERQSGFDDGSFQSNFKKHSKVIWYKPPDKLPPTRIFIRLNIGKIPLTNAELIKALFLNSSNFNRAGRDGPEYEKIIELKQLEIASEWDGMEYELQNNEFWHFINANKELDKSDFATRIEFIFKLMRNIEPDGSNDKNQYGIFKFFVEKFSKKIEKKGVGDIWREIKQCYYILREWFLDREFYHKIGYLLHIRKFAIKDLYKVRAEECETKTEFNEWLNKEINKTFRNIDDINELDFNSDSHKKRIGQILLWHNIYTVCNKKNTAFFSFYNYKTERWSIEHIHAQHSKEIAEIKDFQEWTKPVQHLLKNDTRERVRQLTQSTKEKRGEEIKNLTEKIIKELDAEYESDNIENLALLTSADNSSLSNEMFAVKRQAIIDREKEGSFIPICTRNVFLKYYTKYPTHFVMWEKEDRKAYIEDICNSITIYQNKKEANDDGENL